MSPEPDDDRALAARAASGDRDALERLLSRHAARIYAVAFRVTRNPDDARDAAQEAMIAVVRGIGRFDGRSAFTTWFHRVTTNAALDEVRRRRRRPEPVPSVDEERASGADTGDEVVDDLHVAELLARLPVEYREAVALRDVVGLDYADIAAELEIPIGTVRSRIARGRARLARDLGNQTRRSERPTTT